MARFAFSGDLIHPGLHLTATGVESALELYVTFVEACLRAYDGADDRSYSPQQNVPRSTNVTTSSARTPTLDNMDRLKSCTSEIAPAAYEGRDALLLGQGPRADHGSTQVAPHSFDSKYILGHSAPSELPLASFDPNSPISSFHTPLVGAADDLTFASMYERGCFMDTIDGPHPRNLQSLAALQQPGGGLNLEQQIELIDSLESNGLTGLLGEPSPSELNLGSGR